jgi:flagellar hook-associated protein 2
MPVNLTGMASGLDTDSIIQQLMQVESTKVTAVQKRQVQVTQHKTDLDNVRAALNKIKSAAADLSTASLWKPTQTTGSSDTTKLDVSVTGGAGIGGHSIQINRLASSAQHGYDFTSPTTAGKLTFYYGTGAGADTATGNSKITIDVAANASATDIATAINANDGAPVYAAVIKDGTAEKLVFSSRKTGEHSDFTVDSSALAGALSADTDYDRTGMTLNASINIDGGPEKNPESNIVDTAIPGVRVTLKGVSTSPVTVNTTQPAVDTTAIAAKVKAFVDAYNGAVDSTRTQLTEKRDPKATTSSGLQQGQLFGDSQLNSMLGQLKNQMTQTLAGLGLNGLADLGVGIPKASASGTVSDDAKAGKLVIDSDALNTAINADYTKVRDLFSGKGTTKGLSALMSSFVDGQTSSTGIITGRMNTDDTSLKDFTSQIDALNKRMDDEQTRMKAQFAAMEAAMSQSQTQQAWLSSQISSLP